MIKQLTRRSRACPRAWAFQPTGCIHRSPLVAYHRSNSTKVDPHSNDKTITVGNTEATVAKEKDADKVPSEARNQFGGLYIVSIPITNDKSYISCHHPVSTAQAKKFPLINKLETKVTALALKGWTKLSTSKNSVNVRITAFVKNLLDSISYEENCLTSFPSKSTMVREIKESIEQETKLMQTEIDNLSIPLDQLKPITVYHPEFQQPSAILAQMHRFRANAYQHHKKWAILSAIAIPLTLPFALVPVLPNIPGFYATYRLYCNIKALLGVKHLDYLLESDTHHLRFKAVPALDKAYTQQGNMLLTQNTIDTLSDLGLDHLKSDLQKALKQETAKLDPPCK